MSSFDVQSVRQDFPILQQSINEHPLVYLDSAATTQKPRTVIDAISQYYVEYNSNVHRGLHTLSEKATQAYEDARAKIQRFINAKSYKECIFVRGTTEAINLVAHSFVAPRIAAGEEIILTEMEHHANIVPWQLLSKKTGANIRVAPILDNGELDLEALKNLINEKTKILGISHVSNALGTINPIKEIIQYAHEHDVIVVVDGAQGAAHEHVDVQDLDADFYAFSAHKMYGPTGIGVLYGKQELLEMMIPYQGGGEMISHVSWDHTEYNVLPHKFEAGTPNISGAIGMGRAIDYLEQLGRDNIKAYEQELLAYAIEGFKQLPKFNITGTAKHKASMMAFCHGTIHAHDVGTILSSLGIAVRAGHHCAMPLMDRLGVAATTRASFSFYNTMDEIDALIKALIHVREVFS